MIARAVVIDNLARKGASGIPNMMNQTRGRGHSQMD
jgi:hypothetical protein